MSVWNEVDKLRSGIDSGNKIHMQSNPDLINNYRIQSSKLWKRRRKKKEDNPWIYSSTFDRRPPPPSITFLVNPFCCFNFTYNFRLVSLELWAALHLSLPAFRMNAASGGSLFLIIARLIGQHVGIPETTLLSFKITKTLSSFEPTLRVTEELSSKA